MMTSTGVKQQVTCKLSSSMSQVNFKFKELFKYMNIYTDTHMGRQGHAVVSAIIKEQLSRKMFRDKERKVVDGMSVMDNGQM